MTGNFRVHDDYEAGKAMSPWQRPVGPGWSMSVRTGCGRGYQPQQGVMDGRMGALRMVTAAGDYSCSAEFAWLRNSGPGRCNPLDRGTARIIFGKDEIRDVSVASWRI